MSGRLCLVLASVLWSLSGGLTRILQKPEYGFSEPALTPIQMAFYRSLFAGLFLLLLCLRVQPVFRPLMPVMVGCFAAMNAFFLTAIATGTAAHAILLQNCAPFFVFFVTVFLMKEPADGRSFRALLIGLAGMAVIVLGGGGQEGRQPLEATVMAICSGITYAGIILFLRYFRDCPAAFLSMINHLGAGILLALAVLFINGFDVWWDWLTNPTGRQLALLAAFGVVQMALPYWLFARALRTVSPQEAGAITLLEPMLNPVWAYLVSPETDRPGPATFYGGALILGALAYRYLPMRKTTPIPEVEDGKITE
jgi:drug/metabolite transporter, DME family